jgi:phenylpyruvate tautomerase PptA (4-oxalocrotonate tautomerase family)
VLVRITLRWGRTPAQKRTLYATIAARAAAAGMRPEDVMVVLVENALIDWTFGAGVAQIAPPQA